MLPLRGKILNVEKSRIDSALNSNEIKALIQALGCGVGNQFDLTNLRYGKVIIMTDADVDGAHIITLLLTFFFRYMDELITSGHLFLAQPPLYRITAGKATEYVYTEEEKDARVQTIGNGRVELQRYKGLGEMNPDQLWETTMDPARRMMVQVTIDDAAAADRVFDMLMGSDVPPRRKFIQTHAREVENLDI